MYNAIEELAPNANWVHENSAEVKIKSIQGHKDSICNCQLIDNDRKIFTASNDLTARIWDFKSGKELKLYSNLHESNITKAHVNTDNTKFVSSSCDKTVKCWDLETGALLWSNEHDYLVTFCSFSNNDGNYVLSVSDVDFLVKIWDSKTGKLVNKIEDIHQNTITTCRFSPNNNRIITTSMDKTSKFYDLTAKKATITLGGHTSIVSNCSITPDERCFVTCSWDKTIQVWDVTTGMYRKNGPFTLFKGHEGSISSCSISNIGSLCVSGGYDGRIVLWNLGYQNPKLVLRGHTNWVNDVAITADNRWIVSVGKDKEIREWDIENYENIKLVIEQNRNLGNKLLNCSNCLRTFTSSKLEKNAEKMFCVFCRLQERTMRDNEKDPFLFVNINDKIIL